MNDTVMAIDFGTSNSLAGAWHKQARVEAIALDPAAADPTLMRTLLYFPHAEECHYGSEAIQRYLDHEMEGRLFRSFKSHLPNRHYLGTFVEDRLMTLENMIGVFLLEMKKRVEAALDTAIERAVIGRPARYSMDPEADEFALYRMTKAAEFAGFKDFKFVPEPLAAALDFRRGLTKEKIVLVGDFGGGTSDFTLIRIGPYAFKKEHVLALDGCPLAGDALDSLFMSERLNRFFGAGAEYKVALGNNRLRMPKSVMQRLNHPAHIVHLKEAATYDFIAQVRKGALGTKDKVAIDRLFLLIEDQQIFPVFEAIERTKRGLSDAENSTFRFDYPGLELNSPFSRDEFQQWAQGARDKIFAALDNCLDRAQLTADKVDLVCLTGGSAQVPLIRAEFERRFAKDKLQTQAQFHSVLSGLIESAAHDAPAPMDYT
jgi:hypothetical chaperone protein